jgi:hypothetical protein
MRNASGKEQRIQTLFLHPVELYRLAEGVRLLVIAPATLGGKLRTTGAGSTDRTIRGSSRGDNSRASPFVDGRSQRFGTRSDRRWSRPAAVAHASHRDAQAARVHRLHAGDDRQQGRNDSRRVPASGVDGLRGGMG